MIAVVLAAWVLAGLGLAFVVGTAVRIADAQQDLAGPAEEVAVPASLAG